MERDELGAGRLPMAYVMMATYQGERYVGKQIESVLGQRDVDVTVRVCDDASYDATFEIVSELARAHDHVIASRNERNLGFKDNFLQMIYEDVARGYDYYAFSDQDDVWLEDKLAAAVRALRGVEGPALFHAAWDDVDEDLSNPRREWWETSVDLDAWNAHRGNPLLHNYVPGCTMVFNRELFDLLRIYQVPALPRAHDSWVYMIAYYLGTIIRDFEHAYTLRRLHASNVVGQDVGTTITPVASLARLVRRRSTRDQTCAARYMLSGYGRYLSRSDRLIIEEFLSYDRGLFSRMRVALSPIFWMPVPQMRLNAIAHFLTKRF